MSLSSACTMAVNIAPDLISLCGICCEKVLSQYLFSFVSPSPCVYIFVCKTSFTFFLFSSCPDNILPMCHTHEDIQYDLQ